MVRLWVVVLIIASAAAIKAAVVTRKMRRGMPILGTDTF